MEHLSNQFDFKLISQCFQIILIFMSMIRTPCISQDCEYHWMQTDGQGIDSRVSDIASPEGYQRILHETGAFGHWLRQLPLKSDGAEVKLHNGTDKSNQNAHARVIDIDVGDRDLQQCADAIIRLAAEYLFQRGLHADIAFNFTSGHRAEWNKWKQGWRPIVKGNQVTWKKNAATDSSYANFRHYLNTIFTYAGSYSLSRELVPVGKIEEIRIGDVFIQGGFPGHAVMVMDVAIHESTGKTVFLLAQSYMPAQEMHILKNPHNNGLSPWYALNTTDRLYTPEWTFAWKALMRFSW